MPFWNKKPVQSADGLDETTMDLADLQDPKESQQSDSFPTSSEVVDPSLEGIEVHEADDQGESRSRSRLKPILALVVVAGIIGIGVSQQDKILSAFSSTGDVGLRDSVQAAVSVVTKNPESLTVNPSNNIVNIDTSASLSIVPPILTEEQSQGLPMNNGQVSASPSPPIVLPVGTIGQSATSIPMAPAVSGPSETQEVSPQVSGPRSRIVAQPLVQAPTISEQQNQLSGSASSLVQTRKDSISQVTNMRVAQATARRDSVAKASEAKTMQRRMKQDSIRQVAAQRLAARQSMQDEAKRRRVATRDSIRLAKGALATAVSPTNGAALAPSAQAAPLRRKSRTLTRANNRAWDDPKAPWNKSRGSDMLRAEEKI